MHRCSCELGLSGVLVWFIIVAEGGFFLLYAHNCSNNESQITRIASSFGTRYHPLHQFSSWGTGPPRVRF